MNKKRKIFILATYLFMQLTKYRQSFMVFFLKNYFKYK